MSATLFTKARWAFRARAQTLAYATASGAMSCAGKVYTRNTGDFSADGFMPGDIVNATGFSGAGNGYARVTAVTASTLTVDRTLGNGTAAAGVIIATLTTSIAWEGVRFTPVTGTPFAAETMQPVGSDVAAVGARAIIRHSLVHTLTLFYPSGEGPLSAERVAGGLMELFRPGTALDVSPNQGYVTKSERRPLVVEPDWTSLPVLVSVDVFAT